MSILLNGHMWSPDWPVWSEGQCVLLPPLSSRITTMVTTRVKRQRQADPRHRIPTTVVVKTIEQARLRSVQITSHKVKVLTKCLQNDC